MDDASGLFKASASNQYCRMQPPLRTCIRRGTANDQLLKAHLRLSPSSSGRWHRHALIVRWIFLILSAKVRWKSPKTRGSNSRWKSRLLRLGCFVTGKCQGIWFVTKLMNSMNQIQRSEARLYAPHPEAIANDIIIIEKKTEAGVFSHALALTCNCQRAPENQHVL